MAGVLGAAAILSACAVRLPGIGTIGGGQQPGGAQQAGGTPIAIPPTPTPLPTRVVAPSTTVSSDGVLALAVPAVGLGFDISSKVTAVNVTAGQRVKAGDVLATLDDTALRDAVTDAQLSVDLTEAQIRVQAIPSGKEDLAAAQAALDSANASYASTKAGISQSDIDKARRNAEAAEFNYLASQTNRNVHCGGPQGVLLAAVGIPLRK